MNTPKDLIANICRENNITPKQFYGQSKTRELSRIRRLAIHLLHKDWQMSYRGIAKEIKRSHFSV